MSSDLKPSGSIASAQSFALPLNAVVLAPLAGVSDHPMRRLCYEQGADLAYVEMLSATALIYQNKRTFDMMVRHPDEPRLGVQFTAKSASEAGQAAAILAKGPYETLDLNMGCPVRKVVDQGCGSAFMRDPERVFQTVKAVVDETDMPVSVKMRLGWDRQSVNAVEVAQAAVSGGAAWIVVHGRTRSEDYGDSVDLQEIARVKQAVAVPVIGNGNIFEPDDRRLMQQICGIDGVMVSRGALGDPWVFRRLKGDPAPTSLDEWLVAVEKHLTWQEQAYGASAFGCISMRKHMIWYASGWPGARKLREKIVVVENYQTCLALMSRFAEDVAAHGCFFRERRSQPTDPSRLEERFRWDPKADMDRERDRGVGAIQA